MLLAVSPCVTAFTQLVVVCFSCPERQRLLQGRKPSLLLVTIVLIGEANCKHGTCAAKGDVCSGGLSCWKERLPESAELAEKLIYSVVDINTKYSPELCIYHSFCILSCFLNLPSMTSEADGCCQVLVQFSLCEN